MVDTKYEEMLSDVRKLDISLIFIEFSYLSPKTHSTHFAHFNHQHTTFSLKEKEM